MGFFETNSAAVVTSVPMIIATPYRNTCCTAFGIGNTKMRLRGGFIEPFASETYNYASAAAMSCADIRRRSGKNLYFVAGGRYATVNAPVLCGTLANDACVSNGMAGGV